jgi:hypothetical protein
MNKSMKKSIPVARQQVAPLTPEQKQEAMLRFFTQKRESFTTGILFNLCQNPSVLDDLDGKSLVDTAVDMADYLIEKLYPLKEESETIKAE